MKQNSSRSGKSQGILFWVRENWHFEEKSEKIEIITPLIQYHWRLEEIFQVTVISMMFLLNEEGKFVENLSVLNKWAERKAEGEAGGHYYIWHFVVIWSGKLYFYQGKVREKSGNFENWCLWQPWIHVFICLSSNTGRS